MGLGKTIQALAFLKLLEQKYSIRGPFMIISPLSVIPNWVQEINEWTDFRTLAYFGNEGSREVLRQHCFYSPVKNGGKKTLIFDIVVISYDLLIKDFNVFRGIEFAYLILDEAHKIKNFNSKSYKFCSEVKARNVLLLTGTPIQNNVLEIYSLFHFIDPQEFRNIDEFETQYNESDPASMNQLREKITPYILRRKKVDVDYPITAKEETIIEVELTNSQRTIYKSILNDNREVLLQTLTKKKTNLNNILMQLRKVCCHPYLIDGIQTTVEEQYKQTKQYPPEYQLTNDEVMQLLIMSSGKTILIDKLLPKLHSSGHKVLIFSQMTQVLDILEDYLTYKNYLYERLDGATNTSDRQYAIDQFKTNPNVFIFLLSTRAGGLGLNLTEADTVIIYDSDWNPQNDIQAQARCHRIGQEKDVK
ncbi:SNF2 family N-terminal domain containing protein [Histomonas meleagridis]|uniref:SNF2 family N-terminal domain containing protein n=1 Tax=Histomonas meleagridis TaxID=135588 RepID=UPI003559530A|nr:SNF2 family N-terminal domain containing protein [Histomonas meleagridis]KAH0801053.1 SNF2 family N-terminal domain containing protein [Histomonas meleagridis]